MNTGNYTIRLLFIIFLASVAQKANAQESELNETMRRWLREQNERTIEPDFRLPQQPQQFPQIQHQQRQQEVLRVSPTTRLPSYLDRLQTGSSLEEKYRNMRRNMCMEHLPPINVRPDGSTAFDVDNRGRGIIRTTAGQVVVPTGNDIMRGEIENISINGFNIVPLFRGEIEIFGRTIYRSNRAQQTRLRRMMREDMRPTLLDFTTIYEINERTNQLFREMKNSEEGLD